MSVLVILISYLVGSISFGYLIALVLMGQDVRTMGSGNPGATNIFRVLGAKAGIAVLLLDILKGSFVILLCQLIEVSHLVLVLSGLAVVAGHNWPIFFSFKGGKGAATTLGVFFAIDPVLTLLVALFVILVVAISKYMSLGSILGGLSIPFLLLIRGFSWEYIFFGVALSLLILWRHRTNIKRLLKGTENKIGNRIIKGR